MLLLTKDILNRKPQTFCEGTKKKTQLNFAERRKGVFSIFISHFVGPPLRALYPAKKKTEKKTLPPKNKWLKANCIHFKYSRFWPKDINNKRTKGIKSAIFLSLAFLPPFFLFFFFLAGNYLLFHLRLRLQIIIRSNGHCYCFFYGRLMPRNRTATSQPPTAPLPSSSTQSSFKDKDVIMRETKPVVYFLLSFDVVFDDNFWLLLFPKQCYHF